MERIVANTLPDNDAVRTWIEGKMKLHYPEFCKILGWTGDVCIIINSIELRCLSYSKYPDLTFDTWHLF